MDWTQSLYVVTLVAGILAVAAATVYLVSRHTLPWSRTLLLMALAGVIWVVAYVLELISAQAAAKDFWNKVQYVGITILPAAWLVFGLGLAGRHRLLTRWIIALLCVEPIAVLLVVFTNESHGLFWELAPFEAEGRFSILNRAHGALYWAHAGYSLVLYLIVIYLLVQMLVRAHRFYRWQIGLLLAVALIPLAGNAVMQMGVLPSFVDLTPVAYTVSSLVMAVVLLRSRVGDIVPLARGLVVDSMDDGLLVLDPDYRIVDMNPAAQEIVGAGAAESIGLPVVEVWPDWPGDELLSRDAGGEIEISVREGEARCTYSVRLSSVIDWRGYKTGWVVVLRDITERRRSEDLLRIQWDIGHSLGAVDDLAVAWDRLLEIALRMDEFDCGGIYVVNEQTGGVDLAAHRGLSPEFVQLVTHYDVDSRQAELIRRGEPVFASYAEAISTDNPILIAESLLAFAMVPIASEGRILFALNLASHSVSEIPTSAREMVRSIATHISSAVARVRAEGTLRRRNRELTMLYEIAHGISSTLDLEQVLERIATYARDLLETDDSEVYLMSPDGQTLQAVVALGEYAEEIKATPIKLGEGFVGYVAQTGEAVVVADANQDPRALQIPDTPVESHPLMCVPLVYAEQVMGVIALAKVGSRRAFDEADLNFAVGIARHAAIAIENARLYEAEQQRSSELALALQRQRELDRLKDEFLQNVSHELRSPLALIRGYAEMLNSGELGELQPDQIVPVSVISRRARMLGDLVKDIMLILEAELDPPVLEPVQIGPLTQAAVEDFQLAAAEADLALMVELEPNLPPVGGIYTYVRRILDNLIGNALKFTPKGGTIALRVWLDGNQVMIAVQDSGIGISPDQHGLIFDRFYQVDGSSKRRFGGAGLGLALVKELVGACGGQVSVESQIGEGSTFTVTLPVYRSN